MYTLHYAKKDSSEDIQCYEFKKLNDITDFIFDSCCDEDYEPNDNTVYLLAFEGNKYKYDGVILVDSCIGAIIDTIHNLKNNTIGFWDSKESEIVDTIYLQEYDSYEEAYEVALSMKETDPLCYKKELIK